MDEREYEEAQEARARAIYEAEMEAQAAAEAYAAAEYEAGKQ